MDKVLILVSALSWLVSFLLLTRKREKAAQKSQCDFFKAVREIDAETVKTCEAEGFHIGTDGTVYYPKGEGAPNLWNAYIYARAKMGWYYTPPAYKEI